VTSHSPIVGVDADLVFRLLSMRIAAFPEVGEVTIRHETRFDELGLDSIDRLELLVWIEDEFGVELPDENLHSPIVGDLVAALCFKLETGKA
jgi:acyl carrier protein